MRQLRAALVRFVSLFDRDRLDRELAAELESHVAMHVDDNLRAGMTAAEARRQALLKLGGVAQITELCRERRGVPVLENLIRDLRFAARMLLRDPGFSAVAVLTLALGIGANTAIFSVVNAVLLRPLPFPQSERLVLVWATDAESGRTEDVTSYPNFADWKARSRGFEWMAAFTTRGMTIADSDRTELAGAVQATPGFFETLGVAPALGRTFRPDEGEIGAPHVALLSDSTWKRSFGGRRDVLGKSLRANEETYTIIGVMPPDFRVSFDAQRPERIYVPLIRDPERNHGFLLVLGRLRPGVRLAAAQAEMNVITGSLEKQFPATNRAVGSRIVPLVDALAGRVRTGLLLLLGVVTLVLLIACVNVANLLLARNASRQRELALRAALGAGRARLLQQSMAESTVLALAGGALGLLFASWTARLLVRLLARSFQIPRIESTATDGWVLGFAFLLSLATGLLFGAVFTPISASAQLDRSLRESGRTATGGVKGRRLRGALVVIETALALVLLAAAGFLLKNLMVLRSTAPGFATKNLLTVGLQLPKNKYAKAPERWRFFENLLARAEAIPGVRSAALVTSLPLGNGSDSLQFHIVGRPDPAPDSGFTADFNIVSPGYFRTMAIPVRAGRELDERDVAGAPGAIVINETAARRFWPGENPVGRAITLPEAPGAPLTVVGVTADVRQRSLGSEPQPEIFLNHFQPAPDWLGLTLVLRTKNDPVPLAGAVKDLPRAIDRDVPASDLRTLDEVLSASLAEPSLYTLLIGAFAALALALSAVGLYGVVSYTVTQRTAELGIRLALGAERSALVRLVLRQGLGLALAGTAIGLVAALAVIRLLTQVLPDAQPGDPFGDPITLAAVAVLLISVALGAAWLPARRASRVDPTVALRYE